MTLRRRSDWEANVRTMVAFICLAAIAKERDGLRELTDELIDWLRENPAAGTAKTARERAANVVANDREADQPS